MAAPASYCGVFTRRWCCLVELQKADQTRRMLSAEVEKAAAESGRPALEWLRGHCYEADGSRAHNCSSGAS